MAIGWRHVINECNGRMALLRDDEKIVIACDVDTLPSVDTFMSENKDCSFAYLGTVEGGEVVEKRYVLRLEIHGVHGGVVMDSNTKSWYESQHLNAFNIWCGHRALADDIAGEVVFVMDVRDGTKEGLTYDNLDAWLKVRRRRRWSPRRYNVHVRCSEPLPIWSAAGPLPAFLVLLLRVSRMARNAPRPWVTLCTSHTEVRQGIFARRKDGV